MNYFNGPRDLIISTTEDTLNKYLVKEIKNLWYLPAKVEVNKLKGKLICTTYQESYKIGKVVSLSKGYVKIEFLKGLEVDTHWVKSDEIISVKLS